MARIVGEIDRHHLLGKLVPGQFHHLRRHGQYVRLSECLAHEPAHPLGCAHDLLLDQHR